MYKKIMILVVLVAFVSCASITKTPSKSKSENIEEILDQAEADATIGGRKIIETARSMISDKEIFVGGCWDYINEVYNRAGFPSNQRVTIYKSKFHGPYIESSLIQPGDWLYFVNHSYSETEHSAIFVAWTDEEKKEALMISYVGEKKKKPGEYKKFILDKVYNVFR